MWSEENLFENVRIVNASYTNCRSGIHANIDDATPRILLFRARNGPLEDHATNLDFLEHFWAVAFSGTWTRTSGSTALSFGSLKT